MADESAETNQGVPRVHSARAFRPLFYWLVIGAGLLAWDYDRKHAPRTTLKFGVRIEGKTVVNPSAYSATVGKWRVEPGSVAPIGWRKLRVAMPDAEPFQEPLFVWYGENEVGDIDLKWNRGVLDLKIEPMARLVQLIGPHHGFSLTNASGTTVSIPVGSYRVAVAFEHLSEQYELRVEHNATNPFVIKPNLGTVSLSSEPGGARFRLSAPGRNAVSAEGDAPALLTGLPAGNYQLRAWRGDYVKEMPLDVKKWETNRVSIAFAYGEVKVISDPAGATIFRGDKELGQTPKTLSELKPGPHRFRLEKSGYTSAEVSVELLGTNTITVTTNLLSLRYAEAIANARRDAGGLSPDYRRALTNVELALKEKPDDAEALALKSELEIALRGQEEREAQQKKRAELDARKRSASQAFERTTTNIRQAELFDTHRWEFQSQVGKVREGLLRAFNKSSTTWTVEREIKVDPETVAFYCKPKALLALGRQCVVLASQVDTNEVHVYAKFWDYVVSKKVTISILQGVTPDSLIPIHQSFFPPDQAAKIEARRRDLAEDFHTHLQTELR